MRRIIGRLVACSMAVVFLASCSTTGGEVKDGRTPLKQLSCIAVLPAGTTLDKQMTVGDGPDRSLEQGAAFVTGIMARELKNNKKVHLISDSQAAGFAPEVSGGISGMVAAIGKNVGCDAVMVTTVRRFKQREGTEYASDDPASADLHIALMHAGSGAVLWTADFRETQESFLENILTFDKMQNRGFKWVSVEQLVEQGLTERLAVCPYLQ